MTALADRSGVIPVLEAVMGRRRDAEERTSIRLVVVAMLLNAARKHHKAHVNDVRAVISSLDPETRATLGSPHWTDVGGYDRVQRLISQLAATLDHGPTYTDPHAGTSFRVDHRWYRRSLLHAPIPDRLLERVGVAVDGTAMETHAILPDPSTIELDGDYRHDDPEAQKHQSRAERKSTEGKKAKVLAVGADGRNVYTKDRDARAGWRTATNKQKSGFYIGRELHLGTAVAAIKATDRVRTVTFNDPVPPVILMANLTPAGSHRGEAVTPLLLDLHARGLIKEVIADPGYTLARKETFHLPLKRAGIALTLKPVTHQRIPRHLHGALVLDGQLYSTYLPADLRNLPTPPIGAGYEQRRPYVEKFELRSRYRYSRHADAGGGAVRYADPYRSGKLRSPQLPHTMRRRRSIPKHKLPNGFNPDLVDHTLTVAADELPLEQPTIYGTRAWEAAFYGRRNLAETANSLLKGDHVDIGSKYTRHLDTGRIELHLTATLAVTNYLIMKSWINRPNTRPARKRRTDRVARWDDLNLPAELPCATGDPPD